MRVKDKGVRLWERSPQKFHIRKNDYVLILAGNIHDDLFKYESANLDICKPMAIRYQYGNIILKLNTKSTRHHTQKTKATISGSELILNSKQCKAWRYH